MVAGVHVFFTAGVVFGWASFAEVLSAKGVLCDGDDCSGQAAAFAIVFTLGTIGNYTSNLPFGMLLDRGGPQRTCVVASLVQLAGSLCMLAHSTGCSDAFLYIGFFLLGFGGPGVQMATFHMSWLFKEHRGSLIAGSTALFDAGTAVFAAFLLMTREWHISLTSCWTAYTAAVMLILCSGALLWPSMPFEPDVTDDDATPFEQKRSLCEQLLSRPYLYLILFAAVHIMRLNYVVATFQQQVGTLGFGPEAVEDLVVILGALLPFGFVGMPLIGYLLDHSTPALVFAVVNVVGVITHTLLLVPESRVALLAAMCFVAVGRQFVYSTFFSSLQELATPSTYGMLAGMANLCVAATGVLQPALVTLSTERFASWGLYAFAPANLLMVGLVLLLFSQPLSCWREGANLPTAADAQQVQERTPGERGPGASTLTVSLLSGNGPTCAAVAA